MEKRMRTLLLDADCSTCLRLVRDGEAGSINDLPTEVVDVQDRLLIRQDGRIMRHSMTEVPRVGGGDLQITAGEVCGHLASVGELSFNFACEAACPVCGEIQSWIVPSEFFWE